MSAGALRAGRGRFTSHPPRARRGNRVARRGSVASALKSFLALVPPLNPPHPRITFFALPKGRRWTARKMCWPCWWRGRLGSAAAFLPGHARQWLDWLLRLPGLRGMSARQLWQMIRHSSRSPPGRLARVQRWDSSGGSRRTLSGAARLSTARSGPRLALPLRPPSPPMGR